MKQINLILVLICLFARNSSLQKTDEFLVQNVAQTFQVQLVDDFHYVIFKSEKAFEILVKIGSQYPIEFNQCEIFVKNAQSPKLTNCQLDYDFLIKPNDTLTISKKGLNPNMKSLLFEVKNVISGCGESGRRDILAEADMPIVYHNDHKECAYKFETFNATKMISLNVETYPEDECRADFRVAHSNKPFDYVGISQAIFKNASVHKSFDNEIYVLHKFTILKMKSCRGGIPYQVKVELIQRSSQSTPLNSINYKINSDELLNETPEFGFEIINQEYSHRIKIKLLEYSADMSDCNSGLVVYGVDRWNDFKWFKQTCHVAFKNVTREFRFFKILYLNFYLPKNADGKFDSFKMNVIHDNTVITKPLIFVPGSEIKYPQRVENFKDFRDRDFEVQIEDRPGSQIAFNLTTFNTQPLASQFGSNECIMNSLDTCDTTCANYAVIVSSDSRFVKLCDSIENAPLVFTSVDHKLNVTFSYSKQFDAARFDRFNFTYNSDTFCSVLKDHQAEINYDSSKTLVNKNKCVQQIEMPKNRRIILYAKKWSLDEEEEQNENEEIGNVRKNTKLLCQNQDSILITEKNPKYKSEESLENTHYFCASNPLRFYQSKSNSLFISYHPSINSSHTLKFSLAYFTYEHLYIKDSGNFEVNFAKNLPRNVDLEFLNFKVNLEIKIKTSDDKYISPRISKCDTSLSSAKIKVRTERSEDSFTKICGQNDTYTLASSLYNELVFDFNVTNLANLVEKGLLFKLEYATLFKVLRNKNGFIESNNFTSNFLSSKRETIEFAWTIDLEPKYYIKLKVLNATNPEFIKSLQVKDFFNEKIYWNHLELLDEEKVNNDFLIPSNKVVVSLSYEKSPKSLKDLPYVKLGYWAETRVLVLNEKRDRNIIKMNEANLKDNLEWSLMAPRGYAVMASITEFSGGGQLIFSSLSNFYPDRKYHFNFIQNQNDKFDQKATFVISKENQMGISYEPKQGTFTLEYSIVNKYLTHSSGHIVAHSNDPDLKSPRYADQEWIIQAPSSKLINFYCVGRCVDLVKDNACSPASLSFSEANGQVAHNLCGEKFMSGAKLNDMLLFSSNTSEITVRFSTQDATSVVYHDEKEIYQGFQIDYAFDESHGDCYFHKFDDQFCAYSRVNWNIKKDETENERFFCSNCYASASIAFASSEPAQLPTLLSPTIPKQRRFLRLKYKLGRVDDLSIWFFYDKEYSDDESTRGSLLFKLSPSAEWKTVMLRIQPSMYDFRLRFELDGESGASASIRSIEFFSEESECVLDNNCQLIDSDLSSHGTCQKNTVPCERSRCEHGSVCLNTHDGYKCLCGFGYTGQFCEQLIDPCQTKEFNKCSNNSKCVLSISTGHNITIDNHNASHMKYECECEANYEGEYCEKYNSPCKNAVNPCQESEGRGVCVDLKEAGKFECKCHAPYFSGDNCEQESHLQCVSNECSMVDKEAKCIELKEKKSFYCQCSAEFTGEFCTVKVNGCGDGDSKCQNGGKCVDDSVEAGFRCECTSNYAGRYCEESKVCKSCHPEGTLFCNQTSHECVCQPSHKGRHCEASLDPCLHNPCKHGRCVNIDYKQFMCLCDPEYTGKHCDAPMTACDYNPCKNGGKCRESAESSEKFECDCPSHFYGERCDFLANPCESAPCRNNATCYNFASNFTCHCSSGFTGHFCQDKLNNCDENECAPGSTCVSVLDTYICQCPANKLGKFCNESKDLCADNACVNGYCEPHPEENKYACVCLEGFKGDFCEERESQCMLNNPCNNGQCIDLPGATECKCSQVSNNFNCAAVDFCSKEETKCVFDNMKQCVAYPGGNKCICKEGFTGVKCETKLKRCEYSSPCRSGVCVSAANEDDYLCVNCTAGFGGKNCDKMIDLCEATRPCLNGAECFAELNGFYCKCADGFQGEKCEKRIEIECLKHRCQHNSKCVPDKNGGYRCVCDERYEGHYCEKKVDLCKNVDCTNQFGYCVEGKCVCDPKIPYCKDSLKCKKDKCMNGGTCIESVVGNHTEAVCLCPPGVTGDRCEKAAYCEYKPDLCGESAKCVAYNQNYKCECDSSMIGHKCKQKLDEVLPEYLRQVEEEKALVEKETCKFGYSTQSQIFVASILVGLLIFTIVGFVIGHRMSKLFERKVEQKTKNFYETSRDGLMPVNSSSNSPPNSKMLAANKPPNDRQNKNSFNIPRPNIRMPRTYV